MAKDREGRSGGPVGDDLDQWEQARAAAARLQEIVPDAVLVGGTAAAHHAGHRISLDDDHVLRDLLDRFDLVLELLESTDGWQTARVRRPVLIRGRLDGVETGIRQLRREVPLEVESVVWHGHAVRVPTLPETLRVKAWLVLDRNATRDYLDVVALADRLGRDAAARTLLELDCFYADQHGRGGRRVATQVAKQLAEPRPYDLDAVDLATYKRLDGRWRQWPAVEAACRDLAVAMVQRLTAEQEDD